MKINVVISVDPGEKRSGLSVIMLNREAVSKSELIGFVEDNKVIVDKITEYYVKYDCIVAIEDIVPYNLRVTKELLTTCKFMGELDYRLRKELTLPVEYLTRGKIKKWIFEAFPGLCVNRVSKKIAYLDDYGAKNDKKRYRTKTGDLKKASFHWVDDRIVIAAMKELWNIPTPKPGKKNIYGFSSHAWSALAVGSCYVGINYGFHDKVISSNF